MSYEVEGYKVWFKHYRYGSALDTIIRSSSAAYVRDCLSDWLHPVPIKAVLCFSIHGGMTECFIADPDDRFVVADGKAVCSWRDRFCYKTGRDIAFGRALKALRQLQKGK